MDTLVADRRSEPRVKTLLTGRVVLSERHASFDCMVRSASPSGARIVVPALTPLPESFLLYTPRHDEWQAAEPVWRQGDQVGLSLRPDRAEAARRERQRRRVIARKLAASRARPEY